MTAVQLARKHLVGTARGVEKGPLMADDQGVYVQAHRKWMSRSHPGRKDIFKWADVTSYKLGAASGTMFAGSTINAHHTRVEFRTASNVYSWDLPYDQSIIASRLGRWLAQIDQRV